MAPPPAGFGTEGGLFHRLHAAAGADWEAYIWHPFVRGIADGTLPLPCFQRYLVQDFLFLIQFARAKALAVFKAESLAAMREKSLGVTSILNETKVHLAYCAEWGLAEADVLAEPEAPETVAYTRWVLDRGFAGDILDLEVALAPCTIGYGEIAMRIEAHPDRKRGQNRYDGWIAAYASDSYQAIAKGAAARLDMLGESHGGPGRFAALARDFAEAARLEARFWDMGRRAAP
jgi:thiaminase/transcriptional activator TenA